eukprot:tig00021441_g21539.t1
MCAAAAAAAGQRNRTVTLLDGLMTALRSAEEVLAAAAAAAVPPPAAANASASALRAIAAGRMTPGLFFLLANSIMALPGGNSAVAASFTASAIRRLDTTRRTSLILFCAAAGLAVFLMHARPPRGAALGPAPARPALTGRPDLGFPAGSRGPSPPLPPRVEDPAQIPRSTAREIRAEILAPLFPKREPGPELEEAEPDAAGREAQAQAGGVNAHANGSAPPNLRSDEAAASSSSEREGGSEGDGSEEGEAPALGSEAPSGDREDEVRRAV